MNPSSLHSSAVVVELADIPAEKASDETPSRSGKSNARRRAIADLLQSDADYGGARDKIPERLTRALRECKNFLHLASQRRGLVF